MEIRNGKNHSVHNLLFLSYLLNVDQIVRQYTASKVYFRERDKSSWENIHFLLILRYNTLISSYNSVIKFRRRV